MPPKRGRPRAPSPCLQVTADNAINPAGITKVALDKAFKLSAASKAAIKAAWKPAAVPGFPPGAPPLWIPLSNDTVAFAVPKDKAGAARSAGDDMVGALL
jgi:hypothetical protein